MFGCPRTENERSHPNIRGQAGGRWFLRSRWRPGGGLLSLVNRDADNRSVVATVHARNPVTRDPHSYVWNRVGPDGDAEPVP